MVRFGSVSSTFLLVAVLEKLIESETRIYQVKIAFEYGLYVDNSSFVSNCVKMLVEFYIEARRVLKEGNFNLRQWSSNCPEVMELVMAEEVQCDYV